MDCIIITSRTVIYGWSINSYSAIKIYFPRNDTISVRGNRGTAAVHNLLKITSNCCESQVIIKIPTHLKIQEPVSVFLSFIRFNRSTATDSTWQYNFLLNIPSLLLHPPQQSPQSSLAPSKLIHINGITFARSINTRFREKLLQLFDHNKYCLHSASLLKMLLPIHSLPYSYCYCPAL